MVSLNGESTKAPDLMSMEEAKGAPQETSKEPPREVLKELSNVAAMEVSTKASTKTPKQAAQGTTRKLKLCQALSRWQKAFAMFILLAVAAAITVPVVLSRHVNRGYPVSVVNLPHVAVTNLTLVSATRDDDSKEQCRRLGWIPTGVDWVTANGTISYLCMEQSLQMSRGGEHSNTLDLNTIAVLRRLIVLDNAESCPANMKTVTNLSTKVSVCAEFTIATNAFDTLQYVVDLMTTTEAYYNHGTPGWITWPIDLKMDSGASSMFLSVRYPVRPIIAIKVLHNVATNVIYSICDDQEPQGQWEAPDFVLKSTGATAENTHSNDAIVCVRRLPVADIATSPVLLNITAVSRTATCPQAAANRTSTEISDEQVKLCAEWGPLAVSANDAMSSFVAELALYGSTESEAANTSISTVIPGNWKVVGGKATGSLHTFFLARSFEPFALNLMQDNVANDEEAMPSSVEAVKVLNPAGGANQSTLSFRVLQIADLHLTGDPDYPCRPGPAGTIRVDALKAASAIAQQLTQRNSLSSTTSSNGQGDPLYNECREALTIAFVDELLDIEKPDFVVFSGDNVHTWDAVNHSLAISIFTGRVESRGIPWAAVFGNHDPDGGFDREDMLKLMVEGQQHSHVKYGPRDIGGVGNYEVNVVAPEDGPWGLKGSTVFRMYFLDSHGEIDTQTYPFVTERGGYEWIKESQIEFYRELATSHVVNEGDSEGSSSSQSAVVPAIMYFHIPIPEYDLASSSTRIGDMNEAPTRSEVNCGLFSTLLEMNDVKATFVGHDHVNEYCYLRQGIQLCYGGGVGFGRAYGLSNFDRRARVVEWTLDINQQRRIRSWKRHFRNPAQIQSLEVLYAE